MRGKERTWVTGDQAFSVGWSPGHPQPGQRLPGLQPCRTGPPPDPRHPGQHGLERHPTPTRQVPVSVTVAPHLPSVTPPFIPTHNVTDMALQL